MTKTEKRNHALFMRRTGSMYRSMARRADDAEQSLPFSLQELRSGLYSALFGACCPYCLQPLKVRTFSLDHAVPVSRGGSWDLSNIHVICDPCNRAKGTMTSAEFHTLLKALQEMPDPIRRDVLGRLKAGAALRRLALTRRAA